MSGLGAHPQDQRLDDYSDGMEGKVFDIAPPAEQQMHRYLERALFWLE